MVGEVGEDVADGLGVGGEGVLVSAVGLAVGMDGVGGGVSGNNRERAIERSMGGGGDGGVRATGGLAGGKEGRRARRKDPLSGGRGGKN